MGERSFFVFFSPRLRSCVRFATALPLSLSLPCQTEPPPANIFSYGLYSKAECEAKGGVWKQRDSDIEHRCYFRSMQGCVRNGGVEDRMNARHPKDMKCNFFLAKKKEKCLWVSYRARTDAKMRWLISPHTAPEMTPETVNIIPNCPT